MAGRGARSLAPPRPVAAHLSACLANADLPEDEERLGAALAAQGWTLSSALFNDTFAVLRAGLDGAGRWGVAVTCGAGINCVGVAPDGRTFRFLALGHETGDWGGGGELAMQALWWAMRAEDGRGQQTMLRTAVPMHFGVPEVRDVAIGVYTGEITWERRLELAPVLLEVARRGDEVARDLVRRQADEIAVMALTAMRRLGIASSEVPVVLGGGLLTARDPLLTELITASLTAGAPGASIRVVDVPPVAGAALLGLDHIGAPPSAEARLRHSYDPRSASSNLTRSASHR
jgi:N-acetylglucosamine kinase-like BadF-type ATPase